MKALPSFPGFRPVNLSEQAAAVLREAVRRRFWGPLLPGEHELARQLGISRPSVRAALARLAEDGLVEICKGRRTRLIRHPRHGLTNFSPTVCFITPYPPISDHPVILEIRAKLAGQGIGWEEVIDRTLAGKNPGTRLKELVAGRHRVCWILMGVSPAIQRWFENSGLPAMVLGSCYPGIKLPSVDTDYRAVGRHAAGCLSRNGHRHIALVLPHKPMPGDLAFCQGVTDFLKPIAGGITVTDIIAGSNAASLHARLDFYLARRPIPTAVVTMRPQYTLTVLLHLLQSGLRIPDDVSLISRDTHSILEQGMPALTCYRSGFAKQAHRVVRVAQSLLAGLRVSTKPSLIIPTFVAGSTLAPCAAHPDADLSQPAAADNPCPMREGRRI